GDSRGRSRTRSAGRSVTRRGTHTLREAPHWNPGPRPRRSQRRPRRQTTCTWPKCRAVLASSEYGLALLDERGHALLRVLRAEKLPEARGLGVQILGMPALQRAIARRLRCRERERALRAEQARDLQRLRDQLPRFED